MDRGGENRTGDEEEQRILLETGGVVGRSSKKDLFPHTMADMFRFRLLPSFPTLSPADSPPLPPSCSCSDFSVYFSSPMLFKPIFAQPSRIKNPPVVVRIRKNQGSELGLGFFISLSKEPQQRALPLSLYLSPHPLSLSPYKPLHTNLFI